MLNINFGFVVLSFSSKEETEEFVRLADEVNAVYLDVNLTHFEVEIDNTSKENLQKILNLMN